MEIMKARKEDTILIKRIWEYCFDDSREYVDWYFNESYDPENTLAVYKEGIPVCSLQLRPYTIRLNNMDIFTRYIIGVDTLPEERGNGYVTSLMKESINYMKQEGTIVSLLLPFEYNYYKKYGFETCYSHLQYSISLNELSVLSKKYGNFRKANIENDIEILDIVYRQYVKNKNGYVIRNSDNWKDLLKDALLENMYIYIMEDSESNAIGYIIYGIREDNINIAEMAFTNGRAYKGLLHYIASHYSQAMKMIWNAPCDDILYSKLGKESSIEVKPFVMARIIDVFEFLNRVVKDSDINLTIKINDNLAKWNNNIYEIKNGSVSINNKADDEIECSINVMTQLLMGFVKAEHAYFSGDILCNEENAVKLSEVLDKRHNYINEYF